MKQKELIEHLKAQHPYPTDVFIEPTKEDWIKFHEILTKSGMSSGAFIGSACRIGFNACLHMMEII